MLGSAQAVDEFLRRFWRTVPDPEDVEFVRSPAYQLRCAQQAGYLTGDCDDAATLAASLLVAMGRSCSLIAVRLDGAADFSHVYCRADGIDIDPIVPAELLPLAGVAEVLEVSL